MVVPSPGIRTCGRLGLLRRTLTGLTQPELPADRFDVVIVDDGSADKAHAWLAGAHFPLRLVPIQPDNTRQAVVRSRGMVETCGERIVCLGGDGVPTPPLQ